MFDIRPNAACQTDLTVKSGASGFQFSFKLHTKSVLLLPALISGDNYAAEREDDCYFEAV